MYENLLKNRNASWRRNILKSLTNKYSALYLGGVRCERASAYMRSKGIDDVSQLSGGIHAYQEAFPEGGYFHGKNFVFDPRIAVPSVKNCDEVIGVCCMCSKLYDDYTKQCRCNKCRLLVLVCDDCSIPLSLPTTDLSDVKISSETSLINVYFCSQCSSGAIKS